jgi:hypothetical protein
MRPVNECWLQTPEILDEEIQLRKVLIQSMVGSLYPHIVVDEITKLVEILNERERELTNQGDQLG